jgi:hypothetical protein
LKDLFAAGHFYGEGCAAGYGKGFYRKQKGLSHHYSQQYGAKGYWLPYYGMKKIQPWW